jgi:hypothetical protein
MSSVSSRGLRRTPFVALLALLPPALFAVTAAAQQPPEGAPAPPPPTPLRQPALARPHPPGAKPPGPPVVLPRPVPPVGTPPAVAPPAAPPPSTVTTFAPPTSAPRPVVRRPPPPPEPELPDPEVRVRIIAPSAQGMWTMRLENEGSQWVRVPADVRLLRLTVEAGDTLDRKAKKPVECKLPAGFRGDGFPEPRALLLGPGDAYVETFDPRLFCFGKDEKAITGGAIVRARYGWDPPKGAKKLDAPYVVQGTEFPAVVAPQKQLQAPTIVLSWEAPEVIEEVKPPEPRPQEKAAGDEKAKDEAARNEKPREGDKGDKARDEAARNQKPREGDKARDDKPVDEKPKEEAPVLPVDENAARFELKASPYLDAASGFRVAMTVTATNVGHRPALTAMRARMIGFRIDGPDGTMHCSAGGPTRAIARDGYRSIKPGASASLTILVEEACGRSLFRRPGLYRVTPSLHLVESGAEMGLGAYTGVARVKEPTLVRIAAGPDPFYPHGPKALRAKGEKPVEKPAEKDEAEPAAP